MEFEGTIVNRNNRAKEQVLYKVIDGLNAEIAELKVAKELWQTEWRNTSTEKNEVIEQLRTELRALKSKEYRRSVRRKKSKTVESPQETE